jgi:hypothetical protein
MAVSCLSCRCAGRAPRRLQASRTGDGDGSFGRIADTAFLKQAGAREMGSHCKARLVLGVAATAGRAIGAVLLDPLHQHA